MAEGSGSRWQDHEPEVGDVVGSIPAWGVINVESAAIFQGIARIPSGGIRGPPAPEGPGMIEDQDTKI